VFSHAKVVYTQHFGQRDVEHPESPDDASVYGVASTFKIITVCAVARLVTDGLLAWDTPVREYLPGFRHRKDKLALETTTRDLIANRAGLPMAPFYWGQQNGAQLTSKSEFVRIVSHLPAVKNFRSRFIYSQWNFCLLHIIRDSVTGKSFGDYVRQAIFDPLGLDSATFDETLGENIMKPLANRDSGEACKIKTNLFDSASGLAAGGGGKCNIKNQLHLYIALLEAYSYQISNDTDITPGSSFTQLRTLLTP
jgi:CubicO group peptidase (beta-lactamase class C family)